ncbi:MAG: cyclic nucleotide-binding domain-containing protein [Rubrivivax sp.]
MSPGDAIGYLASALVLLAFSARSIAALRMAAVASNLAFIAYGLAVHLPPVLALHAVLLPLNLLGACTSCAAAGRRRWRRATACSTTPPWTPAAPNCCMPVFGALDERALHFLVECAHQRDVPAGDWFFREGDQARAMFVLERGGPSSRASGRGAKVELNAVSAPATASVRWR